MKTIIFTVLLSSALSIDSTYGEGFLFEEINRESSSLVAGENNNNNIDDLLLSFSDLPKTEFKKSYLIEFIKPGFHFVSLKKELQNKWEKEACKRVNMGDLALPSRQNDTDLQKVTHLKNKLKSLRNTVGFSGESCGSLTKISVEPGGLREFIYNTSCTIRNKSIERNADIGSINTGYEQIRKEINWAACSLKKENSETYLSIRKTLAQIVLLLNGVNSLTPPCKSESCKEYWKFNGLELLKENTEFPLNGIYTKELNSLSNELCKLGFICRYIENKEDKINFVEHYGRVFLIKKFIDRVTEVVTSDVKNNYTSRIEPFLKVSTITKNNKKNTISHLKNINRKFDQLKCTNESFALCKNYMNFKELLDSSQIKINAMPISVPTRRRSSNGCFRNNMGERECRIIE